MPTLIIPCETGQISDGDHTFEELYDHRCLLFLALMRAYPRMSWRSKKHDDGTGDPDWWVGGMDLPTGLRKGEEMRITYHLPARLWPLLDNSGVKTRKRAKFWDKEKDTSAATLERLHRWLETANK